MTIALRYGAAMTPAPISHHFISQRLRLHYVDWGNPDAPPLVLVHGGRDHCRNWDWVAADLARDWHVIAPDLRGHGDSAWASDGDYGMTAFVYDLAQLIHGLGLAPVTLIAHSLGGNVALRYAGLYPANVAKIVAIEGLGPSPEWAAKRDAVPVDERLRRWIDEVRGLAGRTPRKYASIDEALARMMAENQHLSERAGAPPDGSRRPAERGRHVRLEVRQLQPRVVAGRPAARRDRGAVGPDHRAGAARLRGRELGVEPGDRRPPGGVRHRARRAVRPRRPLGPPRPHGGLHRVRAEVPGGVIRALTLSSPRKRGPNVAPPDLGFPPSRA